MFIAEILEKRSRKKTSISYNELQDSEFDELGLGDSTMDETVDSDEDPEFTPCTFNDPVHERLDWALKRSW